MRLILLLLISLSTAAASLPTCPAGETLVFQRANAQTKPEPVCKRGVAAQKPGRVLMYTGGAYKSEDLSKVLEIIKGFEQKPVATESGSIVCPPLDSRSIAIELAEQLKFKWPAYVIPVVATLVGVASVLFGLQQFGQGVRARVAGAV